MRQDTREPPMGFSVWPWLVGLVGIQTLMPLLYMVPLLFHGISALFEPHKQESHDGWNYFPGLARLAWLLTVFLLAGSLWRLVTAFGLWSRKPWARWSVIALGVETCGWRIMLPRLIAPPKGFGTAFRWESWVPSAIGVFAVIYFTRLRVREWFEGYGDSDDASES